MGAAERLSYLSVEEYLAAEEASEVKHEYVGGIAYAMAGGKNSHNLIASNLLGLLHAALRGTSCRAYNSDTKIRIPSASKFDYYYPDAAVVCQPNPPDETFHDRPVLLAEVLSRSTGRIDLSEKVKSYTSLASLHHYLIIDPAALAVTHYHRTPAGFVRESLTELTAVVHLDKLGVQFPLSAIYEGVLPARESST